MSDETTHDAIETLHKECEKLWSISIDEAAKAFAHWNQSSVSLHELKWTFRTHLKDGSKIIDPPN